MQSDIETDEFWMEQALQEARKAAELGEVPVGAVAVYNNQVIGRGSNCKETLLDPTAHAELLAIQRAAKWLNNWRLIDVTLYSTLEPCPMCAGAMIQSRLSRLVYGAKDLRYGADGSVVDVLSVDEFNHRVEVSSGLLEEEAVRLLQEFFKRLRLREK